MVNVKREAFKKHMIN